ncbi:MAG TPA: glycosyltransferase [Anaerolineae bacterium]|nr:glycosyltransferase [Anaerolineae bacterium]
MLVPYLAVGGAERSMLKLAGGIADRGFAVDLVLAHATGPLLGEVPATVHLVDLGARRVLASLPGLVSYLRRERPAALLSVLHANMVALWARRLAGVPTRIAVSERNTLSREAGHYASDLRLRLMPRLARRCYPWADAIVAVSQGVADDLAQAARLPRECIRVIYNPIVTPQFVAKLHEPLEHPWFDMGEPPVIVAVGRLTAQKDWPLLIRCFARLRWGRAVRLLILGEGEERPGLEALVRQLGVAHDVAMPGFVANPYPYMARAATFVLSSRWEGLPGVLIEALCCGVPLVATDCPSGPREILEGGRHGRLVPVGDEEELTLAMAAALDGDVPPPAEGSWRRFELETVVDQYLHVLLESPGQLPRHLLTRDCAREYARQDH